MICYHPITSFTQAWAADIVHSQDCTSSLDEDVVCVLWLWAEPEVDLEKINNMERGSRYQIAWADSITITPSD